MMRQIHTTAINENEIITQEKIIFGLNRIFEYLSPHFLRYLVANYDTHQIVRIIYQLYRIQDHDKVKR